MYTIGFAGTAKNTGKTTTAVSVMERCQAAKYGTALTSIGYDGETVDNITGLPKPRYFVPAGTLLGTAERCLLAGTAAYEICAKTGIQTILGEVLLARVTAPGYVVLAGPNRERDLRALAGFIAQQGCDVTLLDGALNRLVPLIAADGLVLSTGAAFDERIPVLAQHMAALTGLFAWPVRIEETPTSLPANSGYAHLGDGTIIPLHSGSLPGADSLHAIQAAIAGRTVRGLHLPGTIHPRWFEALLEQSAAALAGCQFVFGSPLKLVAGGSPVEWQRIFGAFRTRGQHVAYRQSVPLRLVTVNPFYPHWVTGRGYIEDSIDKDALLQSMRAALDPSIPVLNIREPAGADLLSLLGIPARS